MTQHAGARDAFCCLHAHDTLREHTRTPFYTLTTHCPLRLFDGFLRFISFHYYYYYYYGVVIASRNIEKTNKNDKFKTTALEYGINTNGYDLCNIR